MLAQGRPYLAIPGPSTVPDRVLRAMHRASPDIYEGELIDLCTGLIPSLRAVARTSHHATIYIGNGHAAWEAALSNVLSRGDRVLVLEAAPGRVAEEITVPAPHPRDPDAPAGAAAAAAVRHALQAVHAL